MSPLFRKSPEKLAQQAAADAEVKRIRALGRQELAVILLPELGRDGIAQGHTVRPQQLCEHLLRDFPGAGRMKPLDLLIPVRKALEALQDADLVAPTFLQRSPVWNITDLGELALEDGSVADRVARRG